MVKQFTQEQIDAAYNAAPQQVQDALVTDPYLDFVLTLQNNYNLHVDVAGDVTNRMQELLLGLINPSEFVSSIQEIGVPETEVQKITTDLNAKVFKPLQEKIKGVPSSVAESIQEPTVKSEEPKPTIIPVEELLAEKKVPVAPEITAAMTPPVVIRSAAPVVNQRPSISVAPVAYTPMTPQSSPLAAPKDTPVLAPTSPTPERKIIKEYSNDPYREPIQ